MSRCDNDHDGGGETNFVEWLCSGSFHYHDPYPTGTDTTTWDICLYKPEVSQWGDLRKGSRFPLGTCLTQQRTDLGTDHRTRRGKKRKVTERQMASPMLLNSLLGHSLSNFHGWTRMTTSPLKNQTVNGEPVLVVDFNQEALMPMLFILTHQTAWRKGCAKSDILRAENLCWASHLIWVSLLGRSNSETSSQICFPWPKCSNRQHWSSWGKVQWFFIQNVDHNPSYSGTPWPLSLILF